MRSELTTSLMATYRQFERQGPAPTGHIAESTPELIRHLAEAKHGSYIIDFDLMAAEADRIIDREIAYFTGLGKSFEWKVYDSDNPNDIGQRLRARGFVKEAAEAFMVLDLNRVNPSLLATPQHPVERLTVRDEIEDYVRVQEAVWGPGHKDSADALWQQMQDPLHPQCLYVVYIDQQPVSTARQSFTAGSPFSGLWSGCTLPEYRNRGCYTDLLRVRAQEARLRGRRYLTIDASPMSQPIVASFGFEWITNTHPYVWTTDAPVLSEDKADNRTGIAP